MSTTTRSLVIAFLIVGAGLPLAWFWLSLRPEPDLVTSVPAFRESPVYEQVAIVATFFGVRKGKGVKLESGLIT